MRSGGRGVLVCPVLEKSGAFVAFDQVVRCAEGVGERENAGCRDEGEVGRGAHRGENGGQCRCREVRTTQGIEF